MADFSFYSVADVAARFQVNRAQVHRWIRSGLLKAVNISSGRGDRNSWRISAEALDQFERSRSNRLAPQLRSSSKRNQTPQTFY